MEIPKYRFSTIDSIKFLGKLLDLPYEEKIQDWSYTIADPIKIEDYFKLYSKLTNKDIKFTLMEILIKSTNGQEKTYDFWKYWEKLKKLLILDFAIHEYTIFLLVLF